MSSKTFIIINKIYLYVIPAVQKFLILHKNVPIFIKTLNLLFSEKHICRFAPLVLSFLEWHLWQPPRAALLRGRNTKLPHVRAEAFIIHKSKAS